MGLAYLSRPKAARQGRKLGGPDNPARHGYSSRDSRLKGPAYAPVS